MRPIIDVRTPRPVRLDRSVEPADAAWPIFDLDLVQRAFKESMLVARLHARPARYVRGRGRR